MAIPPVVTKIVGGLRAGYPEGVPQHDYMPIFALLGTELTNDEVTLIANELELSADQASAEAIKAAITAVTDSKPPDADLARVRAHLASGGWPLATPHQD